MAAPVEGKAASHPHAQGLLWRFGVSVLKLVSVRGVNRLSLEQRITRH